MKTLADCLKKHGAGLDAGYRKDIFDIAARNKKNGYNAFDSEKLAVSSVIEDLIAERDSIVAQFPKRTPQQEVVDSMGEELGGTATIVPATSKSQKAFQKVAGLFNLKTVFWESPDIGVNRVNGFVLDNATGEIYINVNAAHPTAFIVGHETLHQLRINHKDLYDFLTKNIGVDKAAFDKYKAEFREARKGDPEADASDAYIMEELIADFLGDQFQSPIFWAKLNAKNSTLTARIIEVVQGVIDKLKFAVSFEGTQHIKNFSESQDAIVKAMAEYINRAAEARGEFVDGEAGPGIKFSKVTDKKLLAKLESGEKVTVYRAMQLIDGKLYPPMSAKVEGDLREPTDIGQWEQAEERPELAKDGKFKLDKANKSAIAARYNPYFHTSKSPLNDQFSSAYKRPNLVTVETEIPASELAGKYQAEGAKDSVGEKSWNTGPVSSKMPEGKKRTVILSRWAKVKRVVADSEVAAKIAGMLKGEGLSIPDNVVTPSLREELVKQGVEISDSRYTKNIKFSKTMGAADSAEAENVIGVTVGTRPGEFGWSVADKDTVAPPIQHPVTGKPRPEQISKAIAKFLRTVGAKRLFKDAFGVEDLKVIPIEGTWLLDPEPTFVLVADGMTFDQANEISKMLGFGFDQEMAFVSMPSDADAEGTPAVYLGNKNKLTKKDLNAIREAAKNVGLDFSTTTDGHSVKFMHFGGSATIDEFHAKAIEIQKATGLESIYQRNIRSEQNDPETYLKGSKDKVGRSAWYSSDAKGPSELQRRTIDHILIPYAKAVAAEGYRFSPERFQKLHNLTASETDYIRVALMPKSGRTRSTAKIVSGEEVLEVEHRVTKAGKKIASITNVMWALQNRAGKFGLIDPKDRSKAAQRIIAQTITDEVAYNITNGDSKDAIGWYDKALKRAKKIYYEIFPELETDQDAAMLFDAILGITSQGSDVHTNSRNAVKTYALQKSGDLATAVNSMKGTYGKETRAIEGNLLKLKHLIDTNGYGKMGRLFNRKRTVSAWNKQLREDEALRGPKGTLKIDGAADQKQTGWFVFGPKIGSFINNLHGDYSTLTADLWFSRTWNRILGFSFKHTPDLEQKQYTTFKEEIIAEWDGGKSDILKDFSETEIEELLVDPDAMLKLASDIEAAFRKSQYRSGTPLKRSAKVWVEGRNAPHALPRGLSERAFQQATMERAQRMVKSRTGKEITIADMQAALWYHEKELFAKLGSGTKASAPADYADAAAKAKSGLKDLKFSKTGELDYGDQGKKENQQRDVRVPETDKQGSPGTVLRLTHWGRTKGLKELDPNFHGSGLRGAESRRKEADPDHWVNRTYFGLEGYKKEPGLGSEVYTSTVNQDKIYDLVEDPDNLRGQIQGVIDASSGWEPNRLSVYEQLIEKAGYDGYHSGPVVAMFKPTPVSDDPRIKFSKSPQQEAADKWYSQMEKVLDKKLNNGPVVTVTNQLKAFAKKGEFKQEELEWSGVLDWLGDQHGKIKKDDVIAWLKENNVQVLDIVKGKTEYSREVKALSDRLYAGETLAPAEMERYTELKNKEEGGDTKFSDPDYQLPGGKNYKEILLTLPNTKGPSFTDWMSQKGYDSANRAEHIAEYQREHPPLDKIGYKSQHWEEPNVLAHIRMTEREVDGKKVLHVEEIQSDWHQDGRKKGYQTKQEKPKLKDLDNPQALFKLNQLENKYNETGTEKYFEDMTTLEQQYTKDLTQKLQDSGLSDFKFISSYDAWEIVDPSMVVAARGATPQEAYDNLKMGENLLGESKQGVPDAPFKKTWPTLAMKRMVRYAAENGFDSIAWTQGAEQADRYDLSKRIDNVRAKKQFGNDKYQVQYTLKGGEHHTIEGNAPIDIQTVEDNLGKELAKKIESQEPSKNFTEYSGVDLKVGGKGMEGFYDKILPAEVNKFFGKKTWGSPRVEEMKLTIPVEPGLPPTHQPYSKNLHSFPITPEMKQKALSEGMPLFSKTATANIKDANKPVMQSDYDYVIAEDAKGLGAKASESPSKIWQGIKDVAEDVKDGLDKYLGAISTRLGNIDVGVKAAVRKLSQQTDKNSMLDAKEVMPLIEKAKTNMTKADHKAWDYARKNSDVPMILKLVAQYGLHAEYDKYRAVLDKLRAAAHEVGLSIGEIAEYAPRLLADPKGFLRALGQDPDWKIISRRLRERAAELGIEVEDMTQEQRAALISDQLHSGNYGMGGVSAAKQRKLAKIPKELDKYYADSDTALLNHIYSMNKAIEARKFFGKVPEKISNTRTLLHNTQARIREANKNMGGALSKAQERELAKLKAITSKTDAQRKRMLLLGSTKVDNMPAELEDKFRKRRNELIGLEKQYQLELDRFAAQRDFSDNIGVYVDKLLTDRVNAGKPVTGKQEQQLVDILNARFTDKGTHGLWGAYKNMAYIDTMGSPTSAITQIGDLAWAMYEGGVFGAIKYAGKSLVGKSRITKEQLGFERIGQEFADPGKLGGAVQTVFKWTGLTKMDAIGKETLVNSAFDRYKRDAKKNPDKLREEISPQFGSETDQVIQDLLNDKVSENVELLLYNRLIDFQPMALSEMPEIYLKSGNGRIFYMLKSFTLKQFDIFRNEAFKKMASKDMATRAEGIKNMATLAAFFVVANAGADEIKDFLLGRDTDPEDRMWDNILRLFGVSKFVTWKARTEGLPSALAKQILPPFKLGDSLYKDAISVGDGKGLEVLGSLPIFGKLAYWRAGRGVSKRGDRWDSQWSKEKSKLNKIKDRLEKSGNKSQFRSEHRVELAKLRKVNSLQGDLNRYRKVINKLKSKTETAAIRDRIKALESKRESIIRGYFGRV